MNPGGPGGSGTNLIERFGPKLVQIVRSFDVLGFDPRGTGASTPRADCFASDAQARIFAAQEGHRVLNASDETLGLFRAREQLVAARCEAAIGGADGIARYMSTASVARDMLEISRKLGQEQLYYWGFVRIQLSLFFIADTHCVRAAELWICPRPVLLGDVP